MNSSLRVAVSGGSGYVGSHIVEGLLARGYSVSVLSRRRPAIRCDWIAFDLGTELPAGSLRSFDVLVHAAHDLHSKADSLDGDINVIGAMRLFRSAAADGVTTLVNLSSLSAFEGCRSHYGKTKLRIEQAAALMEGTNIRMGFVCDNSDRGLSGALRRLVRLAPVIPVPWPGNQRLYTIDALWLVPAIVAVSSSISLRGQIVSLASPDGTNLRQMLRAFANQQQKRLFLLPVPWQLLWIPLRILEALRFRLSFRSDSLVSLMNQNPSPDFAAMRSLGVGLSSAADGEGA